MKRCRQCNDDGYHPLYEPYIGWTGKQTHYQAVFIRWIQYPLYALIIGFPTVAAAGCGVAMLWHGNTEGWWGIGIATFIVSMLASCVISPCPNCGQKTLKHNDWRCANANWQPPEGG